ncbi:MAG: hypothetical protein ACREYF_20375 [Gammaproteobacteria bacterium]
MTPPFVDEEAAILAELKKWGEDNVRHLLASNQLSVVFHEPALRWIEEIDQASAEESERRREASQAEQIDITRTAKDAAWEATRAANKANTIATIAVVMAIIAIIISAFAWIYPRP